MQCVKKKGACLAHICIGTELFCVRQHRLRYPFRFGCHVGELRSGLVGWMHGTAEVLEFLTFWRIGTAGCSRFSNLASDLLNIITQKNSKVSANSITSCRNPRTFRFLIFYSQFIRPYRKVIPKISSCSPFVNSFSVNLHRQFFPTVEGVFILQPLSYPR